MKNNRLLGIDFGSKRIGIALSNETGDFALPHSVIESSKETLNDVLKICQENNVTKVIVGESKNFAGSDNVIMKGVNILVEQLRQSGLEVVLHPEFLTSFQAERMNYELRGTKDMLDASSATIILQSYIDSNTK